VDGGTKMIVADAAAMQASPTTHNLAVAASRRRWPVSPLRSAIFPGGIPGRKAAWGRFVLQNGGQISVRVRQLVSGNGSDQIQVVSLRACPDS
jgi:hypothetical protein